MRKALMLALGEVCSVCETKENLTFDCIVPTGHQHHRMSSVARAYYYQGQFRMGNLQVLCATCNRKKSDNPQPRYVIRRGL